MTEEEEEHCEEHKRRQMKNSLKALMNSARQRSIECALLNVNMNESYETQPVTQVMLLF